MCSKTSNLGHIVQLGLGHSLTLLTLCILFKTVFFIETMNPIFQMFSFWAASCLNIWFCAYVHFVCMFVSNVCLICHRCFKSTSKQGRRLRFGMLTVLANIKSTKMLWFVEDDLRWKTAFSGRWPSAEDNLWCKTTFCARRSSVEDDFWWKTTFIARRLWVEDNLHGRCSLVEDDLCWKTTFCGRRPLLEDDLWWKTTFGGRRPLVEDNFWWKTILVCCLVRFAVFFRFQQMNRKSQEMSVTLEHWLSPDQFQSPSPPQVVIGPTRVKMIGLPLTIFWIANLQTCLLWSFGWY